MTSRIDISALAAAAVPNGSAASMPLDGVVETASTCPYCGVGCGVIIESRDDRIVGVRGDPGASGELRAALHEGQHAAPDGDARGHPASPIASSADATVARRAAGAGRLGRGARSRRGSLRGDHRRARTGRGRVLHIRPVADRGLLRVQQAREGSRRHQQRRHELAAVHVERGRRLQADARRRRAAVLLRGFRSRRPAADRRVQHGVRASDPVSTHRGREAARGRRGPADQDDRRRPAPHRHRARGRSPSADRARHRRRTVQRAAASVPVGRPHRDRLHRRAYRRLGGAEARRARLHAAPCRDDLRHPRRRPRDRGALVRRVASRAVAVLPGPEPVVVGHREERGADQPASRDGPDRPARRRPVLADRPAERDGRPRGRRHGEPAVGSSRPVERPASRGGRSAVGRRRRSRPRAARPRSSCSTRSPPARSRQCGSPARTRCSRCPTSIACTRRCRRPSSSCCRNRSSGRRRPHTPTCCCRPRRGARRTAA